jgi:hypothetical protein
MRGDDKKNQHAAQIFLRKSAKKRWSLGRIVYYSKRLGDERGGQ